MRTKIHLFTKPDLYDLLGGTIDMSEDAFHELLVSSENIKELLYYTFKSVRS